MKKLDIDDSTLSSLRKTQDTPDLQDKYLVMADSIAKARAALFVRIASEYAAAHESEEVQRFANNLLQMSELLLNDNDKVIYNNAVLVMEKSQGSVEAFATAIEALRERDA